MFEEPGHGRLSLNYGQWQSCHAAYELGKLDCDQVLSWANGALPSDTLGSQICPRLCAKLAERTREKNGAITSYLTYLKDSCLDASPSFLENLTGEPINCTGLLDRFSNDVGQMSPYPCHVCLREALWEIFVMRSAGLALNNMSQSGTPPHGSVEILPCPLIS